mgnify:CR=1 FL=1
MQRGRFYDLTITGGLWKERQDTVRKCTALAVYDRFWETGRIQTLDCGWREGRPMKPHVFWGSDCFKWLEGAAYLLAEKEDPALRAKAEAMIAQIEKGQAPDGYYNSYFNATGEPRYQNRNAHELYSLGHLIEAGVAWYEATGSDRLLKIGRRGADHADRVFRIEQSAGFVTPGHEEIELALIRLYRVCGEPRYLELAEFFIRQRGANQKDQAVFIKDHGEYAQSHQPVTEQREAVGHAVRAVYLYCAIADLAEETGDAGLREAAERLFADIAEHKMYLTGGIGALQQGEAFSVPYHLPNHTAYAETCAALGLALFAGRLAAATPDARYADAAERALFNGMLAGLSLSGDAFFYENPLAVDRALKEVPLIHHAPLQRQKVFSCSCCPPNLVRMIPSIGDWIYSFDAQYLYVHQYIPNTGFCGGARVTLQTAYPEDGRVTVCHTGSRGLALRKPGWCRKFEASAPCREERGYLYFETNQVTVDFQMEPCLIRAGSRVHNNCGKLALQRGPVVYCLEGQDQPADLYALRLDPDAEIRVLPEKLGGLPLLEAGGLIVPEQQALYAPYEKQETTACRLKFIPYYTFANRGEDDMMVWIPHEQNF